MPDELRHPGAGRQAERPAAQVHQDRERVDRGRAEREDGAGDARGAERDNRRPAVQAKAQNEAEEEARAAESDEELEDVPTQDPDRRFVSGRSS
jgi:hypothetical protein